MNQTICVALLVLLVGCVPSMNLTPSLMTAGTSETPKSNEPSFKYRAAQIISTFENSTVEIQYGYAENINDGRGITAGRAGFTSGTGDMLIVVERYTKVKPSNPLANYLSSLRKVNGTDSTFGLNGLIESWALAANDSVFRKVQDDIVDELYYNPALKWAASVGVTSALGKLIFWDTITQQGEGDDADGLPAIVAETLRKIGKVSNNEPVWLENFLEIRRAHLENAADLATREAWRESVSRIDALQSFLLSLNLSLDLPLQWTVYGDTYNLPIGGM